MSSLTEQERLGLDEVFLSISANRKKITKFTTLSKNFRSYFNPERVHHTFKQPVKMFNIAHKRIKITNFIHLFPKNQKKKKNLS